MSADILELRRTRRGPVAVTAFAPRALPEGLLVPSLCLHLPLKPGTRVQHEKIYYLLPPLRVGMNRPSAGILLQRVT